MENLITVISLQGQAWAVAQDGTRRELKVGDTVAADEMVITADGAQIDLQFANNNQVLTLIGEQEAPVDVVQIAQDVQLSQPLTPMNEQQQSPSMRAGDDAIEKEGHRFVQLVRIGEIIEADGFTPLTVARIQEIIKPLGMALPERDFEQDRWKDNVSRNEHGSSRQYKISISIDVIAEDDIINAAEAQQDITITGTVDGDVKPGDKVTVTVNGKTYETTVNPDGKTWAVDVPGSELVQDKTVAATVTSKPPTGGTITADAERPYEVDTEGPTIKSLPPQSDEDADLIDLDLREHFTDNETPAEELKITVEGLPKGLEYDPTTGKITGEIDKSASQNGPNDDGKYPIKITVTDKAGNTSEAEFEWTVTNPDPVAEDDQQTIQENQTATGNVLTGEGNDDPSSGQDYDPDGDTIRVTDFTVGGTTYQPGETATIDDVGKITLKGDGSYTFTPENGWSGEVPDISYNITDDEGGTDSATLKILVKGLPKIGDLTPESEGGEQTLYEKHLDSGSETNQSEQTKLGDFKIIAPEGYANLTVGGVTVIENGLLTSTTTVTTPQGQTLKITGFDPATGKVTYEYTLTGSVTHDDTKDEDEALFDNIDVKLTDNDGNTAESVLSVKIVDDVPVAKNDANKISEGADSITGNVIGGADASDNDVVDSTGADGATVTEIKHNTTAGEKNTDGDLVIEGDYGTLTIKPDGSYTYELDNDNPVVKALKKDVTLSEEFTYTLTDADGDFDTATLTITIDGVTDGEPTITPDDENGTDPSDPIDAGNVEAVGHVTVHEAGIIGGSREGDQSNPHINTGSIQITAPDGLASITLTGIDSDGDPVDVTLDLAGLAGLSGTPVTVETSYGKLTLTGFNSTENVGGVPTKGELEFSYELDTRYDNTAAADDLHGLDKIPLKVTDAGNATGVGELVVNIIDDVPSIAVDADKVGNLEVDETDFVPATDANFVDGVFTTTEGADGASTTYSLEVEDGGVDSGLIDTATGKPILLYQDGTDVVGRFKDESDTDVEAFRIEINADTGSVTLTQARPLDHPLKGSTPKAHDDPVSINSDAIKLYATAVDGDGDTVKSNGVEVGGRFTFRDDGPTLKDGQVDQDGFVIGNEIVDEQHLPTGSASDATELTVTKELPINFGADGAVSAANETGLIFTNTGALEALNLKSGTTDLTYALSGDGHTITATAGGKEIFTITLSVDGDGKPSYEFTLQGPLDHTLKTDDDNKEYAENIVLPFDITAIDGDGDSVDLKFKVEVKDDTPPSDTRELDVDEDDSVSFSNADVNQTTTTVTTDAQHGTVIIGNDGTVTYEPNEDYRGEDTYTYTVTTANGSYERTVNITVKPVSDKPLFADEDGNYPADTAIDSDGSLNTGTYDYSVQTPEDVPVGLRLHVPKVKDGGSAATSDPSELLGAITIEFKELATDYTPELQLADGTILSPNVSGGFQFVIVDNETDKNPLDWHLKEGLPTEGNGVHYLTEDQYQGLQVQPPAERHENFDVEVSVSSYEVDADGKKLADVDGATSTQTIDVKVQAVTDPIELKIDTDKDAHSYEMDEDTAFNLKDKLTVNYPDDYVNSHSERDYNDGDGVTGPDLDGSEKRWFEITGLPKDAVVNGITVTGPDHVITIEAPGLRTSADELPDINITPPKDFSGDMKGIKVTLKAQDKDSDAGDIDGLVEEDSITLELQVNPVAGDVAIEGTEGLEDTAIKFLENIKVTDDSTATETLGEVITEVSFTVPSGPTGWTIDAVNNTWSNAEGQTWTMNEPADGAGWSGAWSGDTYTITFDGDNTDPINGLSKEARENILKEFTVTPPAHSSKDIDLSVEVTSVDHSIIAGGSSSDPVSKTETITVVVKPVAERVDTDSDGADGNDVTIGDNHVYDTTGEEDKWFVLGDETSSGFKLSAGWSNEDGKWVNDGGWKDVSSSGDSSDETGRSEDTFALLTPYMTKDNDARHNPGNPTENLADKLEGSVFTYEGPDGLVTLPFAGEPVKIPMQYLDTVQFKGPQDWSGVVKVRVQAGTVDYDEDDNAATKLEVSGESWLTNLIIGPKADQVTLKVDAIIKTPEDTQVPLNIIPTSSDPSETFNITIKGIPKGAKITYDGVEYDTLAGTLPSGLTEEGGSYTLKIENFDTSKQPTLTPPKDSNVTIELEVTAQSVDTLTYIDKDGNTVTVTDTDPSKSHTLNTEVQVQGVPDVPVLTLVENKVYTEDANDQDSGQLKVTLSDLITGLKSGETGVADAGPDGSETVTLRISGLPEGFNLENAGPALGGSGESRVWVITEADLDTVQVVVPQHYSGTVNFTAQPVVTENDNPSKVFFDPQNVKFEITPVPEATLSLSSSLIEDTIGELELMPVGDDSDEYISAVRIAEDAVTTAGVTLYDADGNPLTASGGYYTVTNTGTTGAPVVKVKGPANFSGEIKLDIQYQVTDPMTSDTSTAVTSGWQTQGHTLNFAAVTDKIDLALGTITGGDTAAGVTTVTSASTVKVGLNITQKADSNAGGAQDTDGSEKFTHVVVSGVPAGVSVKNAIETAPGEWLITVGELPFNTAELTHSLEFMVSGYADTFEQAITITTYTQDTGAATIEEDSIEWTLKYVSDDGPDPVDLPELDLTAIETSQTEDVSFVLGSVVTGEVIGGSTSAPFDLTVTIRATPDDETTYSGMTRTLVTEGGQQVALWTATVSGVTPANAQTKLDGLLNGITVTPPQDANSNNIAGGTLDLDVNVSAHAHGVSRDAQVTPKLPITPVTDNVIVSVSENVVGEGETIDLNISLSSENDADGTLNATGAGWTVVGDTVFIHIADGLEGALYVNGVMNSGSGTAPAGAPTGLTGGKYYQVTVADLDKLEFRPDAGSPHQTGSLGVTAWVEHKENNDAGSKVSTGEGSLTIEQSNSGYEATITATGEEAQTSGDKEDAIELNFGADAGLVDTNEEVSSAYISGLPSGFTVYAGTDAASSSMANNAGNDTWVIPVTGGALPAYIAILPPANWSGSLTGVNLTVLSGHTGLTPTPTELPITFEVTPVASGISLNPTLSFGDAGELIALNLNASMKDPVAATGATGDAHTERTELKLTGFSGGAKVQFFIGTEVGDGTLDGRVTHDGGGNYTIRDLTQTELDNLKFVHGVTNGEKEISISARTYEVDGSGNKVGVDSAEVTATMNINISPVVATSGADVFLWDGTDINGFGGVDTVQLRFGDDLGSGDFAKLENIEIIDMSGAASGVNSIDSLTPEDVFNMTDGDNKLTILRDSSDTVGLDASWGSGTTAGNTTTYSHTDNGVTVDLTVTLVD